MKKLSLLVILAVLGITNASDFSCSQMKGLASEYFSGEISSEMICHSFYQSTWNPSHLTNSNVGLWNLKKEYCNSICSSVCNHVEDLSNPKVNAECAELVYSKNGFNEWSNSVEQCKSWNQCNNIDAAITGTGGVTSGGNSGLPPVLIVKEVDAAITGTGEITSGGNSGLPPVLIVKDVDAAITGTGGVTGGNSGLPPVLIVKEVDAAITGTGEITSGGNSGLPPVLFK